MKKASLKTLKDRYLRSPVAGAPVLCAQQNETFSLFTVACSN